MSVQENILVIKNSEINFDTHIAKVPNFPKKGIIFYDISPILEDPRILKSSIDALCRKAEPFEPELVAQFLEWLLLKVHGAQLGERECNIRDSEWQHEGQTLV